MGFIELAQKSAFIEGDRKSGRETGRDLEKPVVDFAKTPICQEGKRGEKFFLDCMLQVVNIGRKLGAGDVRETGDWGSGKRHMQKVRGLFHSFPPRIQGLIDHIGIGPR